MKTRNILFSLSLALSLILAACGAQSTPEAMMEKPTQEAMMDKPTEEAMMSESTATPDAMMTTPGAMMEDPAWFSASNDMPPVMPCSYGVRSHTESALSTTSE